MQRNQRFWRDTVAAMVVIVGVMIAAATAFAQRGRGNPNPRILPPHAHAYGYTYGEWGVRYWQWVLSIPADTNPNLDTTGAHCAEAQEGQVWFLAWSFGTSVEKSCTIPVGKAIFTPIFNWIFGAGAFDCEPTVPGVPCDVDLLRQTAADNTEAADILEVTIDGVEVPNVRDYRAFSPEPFAVTFPDEAVFGIPAGTHYPHVADGYWLMLAPLPVGEHEIRVHVRAPDTSSGPIEFESVYHLLVAPRH